MTTGLSPGFSADHDEIDDRFPGLEESPLNMPSSANRLRGSLETRFGKHVYIIANYVISYRPFFLLVSLFTKSDGLPPTSILKAMHRPRSGSPHRFSFSPHFAAVMPCPGVGSAQTGGARCSLRRLGAPRAFAFSRSVNGGEPTGWAEEPGRHGMTWSILGSTSV